MRRSYDSSAGSYKPATLTLTEKRPQLPVSTPAPGTSGKPNPYASSSDHKILKKSESNPNMSKTAGDASLNANRLVLERQCNKLPYDVRETVMSIVNSCFATAAAAMQDHESVQREILALRANAKAKSAEIDILYKRCEKYNEMGRIKGEKIEQLLDEERHNKDHQNKSNRSITRLAKTNRVLIGAFEALGKPEHSRPKSTASDPFGGKYNRRSNGLLPSMDHASNPSTPVSPQTPQSIIRQSSSAPNGDDMDGDDFFESTTELKDTDNQNGKIRASLLRMARDYYKMVKNIDLLNSEVEVLTTNLKYSEKRNRQFQLELEELKDNASISSAGSLGIVNGNMGTLAVTTRPETPEGDGKKPSKRGTGKSLESIDKRLADLVAKRAFDPLDGIKQMRIMLHQMAVAPSSQSQAEVARHLCSRDICKLFEVDAICIFVLQPGGEMLKKYNSRSIEVGTIHLGGEGKSVAEMVLRNKREVKINSHKSRSKLDPLVDGCDGVHTRKLLCVPLMDASNARAVGCMQLINKYQNFKFSEVDDLYAMMFADLAGTVMASALLYNRVWERSLVLTDILEASTSLFSSMPDPLSITSEMPLEVDQVLMALEESTRRALKCFKVKAFIASGAIGLEDGSMVALEDDTDDIENKLLKKKHKTGAIYTVFPGMPGIAGMAMRTGRPYLMANQVADQYHNPQADMNCHVDNMATPMLSMPIVTLKGETIAVIQMLRGLSSPNFESGPSTVLTGRVLFEDAAKWLSFQLSFSLQHILSFVGKPCSIPPCIPEALEPMQRINPTSLALKPIAVGGSRRASDPIVQLENDDVHGTDTHDELDEYTGGAGGYYRAMGSTEDSSSNEKEGNRRHPLRSIQENDNQGDNAPEVLLIHHDYPNASESFPSASSFKGADIFETKSEKFSPKPGGASTEQINVLQAEIKQLKKTIGRLSTIDLNALKNASGNKKSPVPPTISEDDYGSNMGLFFSDDDLDGGNNAAEVEKLKKEKEELVEDNAYLRNEMEGLKELYATATKSASCVLTKEDLDEMELRVASRVREEVKKEADEIMALELQECNATYMARIQEQDENYALQAKVNADLKDQVDTMAKLLADNNEQMQNLRVSMRALSIALEEERVKANDSQTMVSSPPHSSKTPTASTENATINTSVKAQPPPNSPPGASGSRPSSKDKRPQSRESNKSPRGEVAPPVPTEDMVPTSPRYGGWARFLDENGYPYYHNEGSGETSWDRPEGFPEHEGDYSQHADGDGYHNNDAHAFSHLSHANSYHESSGGSLSHHSSHRYPSVEGEVRVGDWVQGHDSESGMPYWRNDISGESVWELPLDAQEGSVGHLLSMDDPNHINSSQASLGYHSRAQSIEHQGSVSSIDYGAASAGDYKIEL